VWCAVAVLALPWMAQRLMRQSQVLQLLCLPLLKNGVYTERKGNRILRYGCQTFDAFWVPDDIESCNFQNLLVFRNSETSQNLMSFRQLLFSLFHGGDQREKSENPKKPVSLSENPVPLYEQNFRFLTTL
jgi:hypothetical protein